MNTFKFKVCGEELKSFRACKEGKQPYGNKDIVVIQREGKFYAFYPKAPDFKGEGMSYDEAVTMLILRDERLKLVTEKEGKVFMVFFDTKKTRPLKGFGLSQKTAVVNLLLKGGAEIYVHYEAQRLEDLKTG